MIKIFSKQVTQFSQKNSLPSFLIFLDLLYSPCHIGTPTPNPQLRLPDSGYPDSDSSTPTTQQIFSGSVFRQDIFLLPSQLFSNLRPKQTAATGINFWLSLRLFFIPHLPFILFSYLSSVLKPLLKDDLRSGEANSKEWGGGKMH